MADGFICLHRRSIDSRVFSDAELWKHWTWLLMRANFADGWFEGMLIPRGSLATGTRSAAESLGSSSTTVHRQWKRLADWGMIELKPERGFTVITICNYSAYNDQPSESGTQTERKRNAGGTPAERKRNADGTLAEPIEQEQQKQPEQQEQQNPPTPQLPPSIRTPAMIEAVASWIAYKTERRESYKPQGLKALYARIANVAGMHGAETVIERMERAKASGWKGWDHDDQQPQGRASPKGGTLFDGTDPRGTYAAASNYLSGGN